MNEKEKYSGMEKLGHFYHFISFRLKIGDTHLCDDGDLFSLSEAVGGFTFRPSFLYRQSVACMFRLRV